MVITHWVAKRGERGLLLILDFLRVRRLSFRQSTFVLYHSMALVAITLSSPDDV